MRIGVNCFLLTQDVGGLKQYFFNLFDWLLAHDRANTYVFLHYEHNLAHLAHLRSDAWKAHARRLQRQEDVLPLLDQLDLYFCPFGSLYPRPLPKPAVFMLPDIQEVFYPQFWTRQDLFNRAYHFKGSTHMADAVMTLSQHAKSTIVEHHRIDPGKVFIAHLCADERYARAAEAARPPALALPADGYLFFPANRWFHKNHDTLLQALARLRAQGRDLPLVVTGCDIDGHYPLMEKAAAYGIADLVSSAGYVSVEEMCHLYRHARALCFPSLFEGFGIPLVEAMLAGCPIAAARATSLPEIGGDAALFFDPSSAEDTAAAIARIWDDEPLRRGLVARGRRQAERFSPRATAEAHLAAFDYAARRYSFARHAYRAYWFGPRHLARVRRRFPDVKS